MLFDIKPLEPIPLFHQYKQQLEVRQQIVECDNCPLHKTMYNLGATPCPPSYPADLKTIPTCMVIGEGPGQEESRRGLPFIGPSGKLLRSLLDHVGIDSKQVVYGNTVGCWPTNGITGKGIKARQPTDEELRLCRGNLLDQIDISPTPYILLVGGTALKAFRPDLKVSVIHGRVMLRQTDRGTLMLMPILHPAALLRQDALKRPTIADLQKWAGIVNGLSQDLTRLLSSQPCVICAESRVTNFDPDGIGYCERHWVRHGNDWKVAREYWEGKGKGKGKGRKKWEPGEGQESMW